MPARIRRDDEVIVIGGKDRGKRGRVLRVEPKKERVYVEGLNIVKRHQRPTQTASGQQAGGGRFELIDLFGILHHVLDLQVIAAADLLAAGNRGEEDVRAAAGERRRPADSLRDAARRPICAAAARSAALR